MLVHFGPAKTTSEISLPRNQVRMSPVLRSRIFQKGMNLVMKPLSSSKVKFAPLTSANLFKESVLSSRDAYYLRRKANERGLHLSGWE